MPNRTGVCAMGEGRPGVGKSVIERRLPGLLANRNLLGEGLPRLAKSWASESLAEHLDAQCSRVQFAPDLRPADMTGSEVYSTAGAKGEFKLQQGPLFANLVFADEVNRAPAKVQAALLEAECGELSAMMGKSSTKEGSP